MASRKRIHSVKAYRIAGVDTEILSVLWRQIAELSTNHGNTASLSKCSIPAPLKLPNSHVTFCLICTNTKYNEPFYRKGV